MLNGKIKPLYNDEILDEYFDVLNRSKFHLSENRIYELLNFFKENGVDSSRFVYHHYSVPTILQVVTRICFRKKLFYYRF